MDPTSYWRDIWFGSALRGDVDELAKMVGDGVDMNAKDHDGWTAAMCAAAQGRLAALRLLAGAGCALVAEREAVRIGASLGGAKPPSKSRGRL